MLASKTLVRLMRTKWVLSRINCKKALLPSEGDWLEFAVVI